MNYSKQRELILNEVLKRSDHPTAEMIYNSLRKNNPRISLGTVYRNLNLLSELNKIKRISVSLSSDCFDKTKINHYHMFCIKCKKVFDVNDYFDINFLEKIREKNDFKIISHEILFIGICKNCLLKGDKNEFKRK